MPDLGLGLDTIGQEDMTRLAHAYDTAVGIISLRGREFVPNRDDRRVMLGAMIENGRAFGFDHDRLVLVALSAGRESADR